MGYYEDALAEWGRHADAEVARLTGEVTRLTASLVDVQEDVDVLTMSNAWLTEEKRRLENELAECRAASRPAMRVGTSLHRETGESHLDAFNRRARNWGAEPEVVRYYFSGLPSAWPVFGAATTIVSFKGTPSDVVGGRNDTAYRAFFRTAPTDGKPHKFAYFHEPEDDIEAGRFTATQYRAAAERIARLAAEANAENPARNLQSGTILMQWTTDPRSGRTFRDYVSAATTWVGLDVYPGPGEDLKNRYQRCADLGVTLGVPVAICETAPSNPGARPAAEVAQWIHDACTLGRSLGFTEWCFFDSTVGGDFRLTDPLEWVAMGEEIQK